MIRCKFKVDSIERSKSGGEEVATLKMTPVTGGSDENKEFWKWTPSGAFVVHSINKAAVDQLELGGEYYIDITPAK